MSFQVLNSNCDLEMLYIRLDMCDSSTISEAKKVIKACDRINKRKTCTEDMKREILAFRNNLTKKLKELE